MTTKITLSAKQLQQIKTSVGIHSDDLNESSLSNVTVPLQNGGTGNQTGHVPSADIAYTVMNGSITSDKLAELNYTMSLEQLGEFPQEEMELFGELGNFTFLFNKVVTNKSGDIVAIATTRKAKYVDETGLTHTYVKVYRLENATWTQLGQNIDPKPLTSSAARTIDQQMSFAKSLDINDIGDKIIIGSPGWEHYDYGRVQLWSIDLSQSAPTWSIEKEVAYPTPNPYSDGNGGYTYQANPVFGLFVSINGVGNRFAFSGENFPDGFEVYGYDEPYLENDWGSISTRWTTTNYRTTGGLKISKSGSRVARFVKTSSTDFIEIYDFTLEKYQTYTIKIGKVSVGQNVYPENSMFVLDFIMSDDGSTFAFKENISTVDNIYTITDAGEFSSSYTITGFKTVVFSFNQTTEQWVQKGNEIGHGRSIALNRDGRRIAVESFGGTLKIFEMDEKTNSWRIVSDNFNNDIPIHANPITENGLISKNPLCINFSTDGTRLIIGGDSLSARVFKIGGSKINGSNIVLHSINNDSISGIDASKVSGVFDVTQIPRLPQYLTLTGTALSCRSSSQVDIVNYVNRNSISYDFVVDAARVNFFYMCFARPNVDLRKTLHYNTSFLFHIEGENESTLHRYLEVPSLYVSNYCEDSTFNSGNSFSGNTGLRVTHKIWAEQDVTTSSDRRIKCNIEDVPDDLALQLVRDIECKYYNYIDDEKKEKKTIGFIAQDVQRVFPLAVNEKFNYIPDHNIDAVISSVSQNEELELWNIKFKNVRDDVNPGTFMRFIDLHSEVQTYVDVAMNPDRSFSFDKNHEDLKIYGRGVNNFLTIEKSKIFALHHAAIQELEKVTKTQKDEIKELRQSNKDMKELLSRLQTQIELLSSNVQQA